MGDVGDEIAAHRLETALLAHVGEKDRVQPVGHLADPHAQVQRVGGDRLAGLHAAAGHRVRPLAAASRVDGQLDLPFAGLPVADDQPQDLADLVQNQPVAAD